MPPNYTITGFPTKREAKAYQEGLEDTNTNISIANLISNPNRTITLEYTHAGSPLGTPTKTLEYVRALLPTRLPPHPPNGKAGAPTPVYGTLCEAEAYAAGCALINPDALKNPHLIAIIDNHSIQYAIRIHQEAQL